MNQNELDMILQKRRDIKQYIVVRKDLNMDYGKFGSQVAHASLKVFADRLTFMYDEWLTINRQYKEQFSKEPLVDTRIVNTYANFTKEMKIWMDSINYPEIPFTKIVCEIENERKLLALYEKVQAAGIVCALITDNGNTEFRKICDACDGKGSHQKIDTTGCSPDVLGGWSMTYEKCEKCHGKGDLNVPTNTCLAIGPDDTAVLEPFTKRLRLYRTR